MIKLKQGVFAPPRIAMRISKSLLCLFLMLVLFGAGWAQSIYVDQNSTNEEQDGTELYPYHDVGAAVAHAAGDEAVDTIIILPGIYRENISMISFPHNLTFRSIFDPLLNNQEIISSTIIQGAEDVFDSVFYISQFNQENAQISFKGLSIRNGKGHFVHYDDENGPHYDNWTQGGGICVYSDGNRERHVSIDWCNIYENYACWGAGIYGDNVSFIISNTNIHDNALYFRHRQLPPDTHLDGRFNGSKGGGIYISGGWSTISNCKIYNNRSYLEESHELYNPLCYGNAAALVWRNTCSIGDVGLILEGCEIYGNITDTADELMRIFDWPFRDIVQIQRSRHPLEPGEEGYNHVEINQCTITDNIIISETPGPNDPYVNTAVGILRLFAENHILGTINNNIVYGNTAGGSVNNQDVSLVHQLYGGSYDDNSGIFMPIRIPIKHCCVNDAHNEDLYYDEGSGSIDLEPLFVDAESRNFNLLWDIAAISPCIDSGYPLWTGDIDLPPTDMGANPYPLAHNYDRYEMPRPVSPFQREEVKWMSFPVLNEITAGHCINSNFFEQIAGPDILYWVQFKPLYSSVITMHYDENNLDNGYQVVNSTQGYKIRLQGSNQQVLDINTTGYLEPADTVVNLHSYSSYGENWVGYFCRESTKPLEALASVLEHLSVIKTSRWSMYKLPDGSWIHSNSFVLNRGDMVVLHSESNCSFTWDTSNPVPSFALSSPSAFDYAEKPDYTSFYVSLPQAKNSPVPDEIGLYVNGVCKGAVVVEDNLLHICAYLEDGEEITAENSSLVFYYATKSAPVSKSIYSLSNSLLKSSKGPETYYMAEIKDFANSIPVSPSTIVQQNYPNPFNPSTTISYEIPEDGAVRLDIYNIKGQMVKTLINTHQALGPHTAIWDGKDSNGRSCASGVYYYRLTNSSQQLIKKMLMLK